MPQKVIFRDDEIISQKMQSVSAFIPFLQSLHTELVQIGFNFSEPEMITFLRMCVKTYQTRDNSVSSILKNHSGNVISGKPAPQENSYLTSGILSYLKDKLIEWQGDSPKVGGLTLSKEKLKDLIELPDLSSLNELLTYDNISKWTAYSQSAGIGQEGALIELGANGYYIVNDAESIIAERFTYRTQTEKGDKYLEELQAICDGINRFNRYPHPVVIDEREDRPPIKKLSTGEYVPSYDFISAFEKL